MEEIKTVELVKYPNIGGLFRHYKGGLYKVLFMAEDAEHDEPVVVYESVPFGSRHTRKLSSFNEVIPGPIHIKDGNAIVTRSNVERFKPTC